MSKVKKGVLLLCSLLLLVAIILFFISVSIKKAEAKREQSRGRPVISDVVESEPTPEPTPASSMKQIEEPISQVEPEQPVSSEPLPVTDTPVLPPLEVESKPVSNGVANPKDKINIVADEILSEPSVQIEVKGTIVNKGVATINGQMSYMIEISVGAKTLQYFLLEEAYQRINVGTEVKLVLNEYSKGVYLIRTFKVL